MQKKNRLCCCCVGFAYTIEIVCLTHPCAFIAQFLSCIGSQAASTCGLNVVYNVAISVWGGERSPNSARVMLPEELEEERGFQGKSAESSASSTPADSSTSRAGDARVSPPASTSSKAASVSSRVVPGQSTILVSVSTQNRTFLSCHTHWKSLNCVSCNFAYSRFSFRVPWWDFVSQNYYPQFWLTLGHDLGRYVLLINADTYHRDLILYNPVCGAILFAI